MSLTRSRICSRSKTFVRAYTNVISHEYSLSLSLNRLLGTPSTKHWRACVCHMSLLKIAIDRTRGQRQCRQEGRKERKKKKKNLWTRKGEQSQNNRTPIIACVYHATTTTKNSTSIKPYATALSARRIADMCLCISMTSG